MRNQRELTFLEIWEEEATEKLRRLIKCRTEYEKIQIDLSCALDKTFFNYLFLTLSIKRRLR